MDHHPEDHRRHLKILIAIIPHCWTQLMYNIGTHEAEGEDHYHVVTDFLGRKPDPLKVENCGKESKITDNT